MLARQFLLALTACVAVLAAPVPDLCGPGEVWNGQCVKMSQQAAPSAVFYVKSGSKEPMSIIASTGDKGEPKYRAFTLSSAQAGDFKVSILARTGVVSSVWGEWHAC